MRQDGLSILTILDIERKRTHLIDKDESFKFTAERLLFL